MVPKLFWPSVRRNCSSDLKIFADSRIKIFSKSLEQFFLTVGQNNFGNKKPFYTSFTYLLVPKTVICLKYFWDKNSKKQPL